MDGNDRAVHFLCIRFGSAYNKCTHLCAQFEKILLSVYKRLWMCVTYMRIHYLQNHFNDPVGRFLRMLTSVGEHQTILAGIISKQKSYYRSTDDCFVSVHAWILLVAWHVAWIKEYRLCGKLIYLCSSLSALTGSDDYTFVLIFVSTYRHIDGDGYVIMTPFLLANLLVAYQRKPQITYLKLYSHIVLPCCSYALLFCQLTDSSNLIFSYLWPFCMRWVSPYISISIQK